MAILWGALAPSVGSLRSRNVSTTLSKLSTTRFLHFAHKGRGEIIGAPTPNPPNKREKQLTSLRPLQC